MPEGLTSEERQEVLALLRHVFEEAAAETLVVALDRVVAWRADGVTRQDFQGLQALMGQLVEGQRELQAALTRLAEAQARTEERVGRVEDGQRRLEVAMAHLAEAQVRTEKELRALSRQVGSLSDQVGGLSNTVGGEFEDMAYIVLHEVLRRELGWDVSPLARTWQQWGGEAEEVNIFGQARDPDQPEQPVWIVGEAKHNLTLKQVDRFAKQVERARRYLIGRIFPVCFCYRTRPEVQARLQELGIRLVFSYGRMI